YPKVKVRDEEKQDRDHRCESLMGLKGFDRLFVADLDGGAVVKEHKHYSPHVIARIPTSYVPTSVKTPTSTGTGNEDKDGEEDKPNIRASSIPRPRAILSSPDNDGMTGSNNKAKVSKDHNSRRSMLSKCRVSPAIAASDSPQIGVAESKVITGKGNVDGRITSTCHKSETTAGKSHGKG
ncbi:hypothetical protein Droror1_Dr00002410, partial [Drosera rotundifolia]